MLTDDPQQNRNVNAEADNEQPQNGPPTISLPKGGGAIRGIGEKFAANPVTGTGSMSVPIATSPGRSGFGPQLSLSYDSGAGNGPFGLGWNLSLPSITRKTDKGLPRYLDATETGEFILTGAEDLVPMLVEEGAEWVREVLPSRIVHGTTYRIQRFKPRTEGLFARIERWTNESDPADCFWRSISRDNITTWYGKSDESRIADPADPRRIFSWLICESYDDKGNVIAYEYKPEDSTGVNQFQVHERNRTEASRSTNRYIKSIKYGNRHPLFPSLSADQPPTPLPSEWLFEAVFDYGEQDPDLPVPDDNGAWNVRHDPFSAYRAGFEVRTYRLCQRVLMFHHFPDEAGVGANCLVRSTDFTYRYEHSPADPRNPIHTVLTSVTQCGYRKQAGDSYFKKTLPPVEFDYSQVVLGTDVKTVEPNSVENLPYGADGANYQWVDLDGEGLSGILTEQSGRWFYKRNESPITRLVENGTAHYTARLGAVQVVGSMPAGGLSGTSSRQFLDLAGDGQVDLVELSPPTAGFYERCYNLGETGEQGWENFRAFESLPNVAWDDPNLKFIDLTGDGHADVLITENEVFTWYPSLAEAGFGDSERVHIPTDEERGPRVVFADGTQTLFQADLSGDGLTDIVRIRNGEVCYWPNLGYGRFGAKVTMDDVPWFDTPDLFDPRRIRLADIDGSGVTDIIYLGRNKTELWLNQSGNAWSVPHTLEGFPPVDNIASVAAVDLLGNGTACLVWSTPLPGESKAPMRYLELMAEGKPHLMIGTRNNLGAETRVRYAPSTYLYLKDKQAGKPWITALPFTVHVVERVETYDHISRNRFVARYAYHHGYFDGVEREFRGFGMVEQWDTEDFAALSESGAFPIGENIDEISHVPPVLTRTWFHTGVYLGRNHVSDFFAGLLDDRDVGEYYREPGLKDAQAHELLLADTVLPEGLTIDEEREACRALKGSMLRQEVYALDDTDKVEHPYSVTEQNFTIRSVQPKAENNHAVFFTHAREFISYQYERNPTDPRTAHALTLEVDGFGNVLKSAAIGYGRRQPDLTLSAEDQAKQTQILITYTENRVTNAIETDDTYRTPLPCETSTYELTGYTPTGSAGRFQSTDFVQTADDSLSHIFDSERNYEEEQGNGRQRRLIEQLRTLYWPDDFGASLNDPLALLPLETLEPLALPGETYKLAFTPALLNQVYLRTLDGQPPENLLPYPANVLGGQGTDQGGYVDLDGNGHWWIPSGRAFYSLNTSDTAAQEQQQARQHFFVTQRFHDPFEQVSTVRFDDYDLLMLETRDPLDNRVTVGERDSAGNLTLRGNDYRVLQPKLVMDPNRNRTAVAFDTLGMVVGTAVMGKPEENLGDTLAGFEADLAETVILDHLANPLADPHAILQRATTRLVYDLFAYQRTKDQGEPQSAVVYTLARETHDADLSPGQQTKIQHGFAYSDGFGREVMSKIQAEPGPAPERDPDTRELVIVEGEVQMTPTDPRWVGTGRTIFDNKGNPVKQYEPFFSDTHRYEDEEELVHWGVTPILHYDPLSRLIRTDLPNGTFSKVEFDPWQQTTWDENDTVTESQWYEERQALDPNDPERRAADLAAAHRDTPAVAHLDVLGRAILSIADNGMAGQYPTHIKLDIEGNPRVITDARGIPVQVNAFNLLGQKLYEKSMDAGERWTLNNVAGNPIRAWDSRGHEFRTHYDQLQRPTDLFVKREDSAEALVERSVYGEGHADAEMRNLKGQLYQQYDGAGVVTNEEYDFKGNPLRSTRQLLQNYKDQVDWSLSPGLETERFTISTTYDALNRPLTLTTPDASVIHPGYNEANLLEQVSVNLRGAAAMTAFVTNIDYDAKGQRELIKYGNGARTQYLYDPKTFRLTQLKTVRTSDNALLQDLNYTYDPVGNITEIRDDAQQTVFFDNAVVSPSIQYQYDAIYRLIQANGREHAGQNTDTQRDHTDLPRMNLPHANDANALRRYTEAYEYDAVGNILAMIHRATNGDWTRRYAYATDSNRLLANSLPGDGLDGPYSATYDYDEHGNMIRMPHLPEIQWDFKDQMHQGDLGGGGTAYYVYDGAGERVRKVHEHNGSTVEERIYLGGYEIYRKRNSSGLTLERETLHIMDDQQRIALVETKTFDAGEPTLVPSPVIRYQLGNHLGSAALEVDDNAAVISYEEYHPYGTSAYRSGRSAAEVSLKRYRYIGKERDDETGLYYCSARYYACWLGRWTSSDPLGLEGDPNGYAYSLNNPVNLIDPGGTQSKKPVEVTGTEAEKNKAIRKSLELEHAIQKLKQDVKKLEAEMADVGRTERERKRWEDIRESLSRALSRADRYDVLFKLQNRDPGSADISGIQVDPILISEYEVWEEYDERMDRWRQDVEDCGGGPQGVECKQQIYSRRVPGYASDLQYTIRQFEQGRYRFGLSHAAILGAATSETLQVFGIPEDVAEAAGQLGANVGGFVVGGFVVGGRGGRSRGGGSGSSGGGASTSNLPPPKLPGRPSIPRARKENVSRIRGFFRNLFSRTPNDPAIAPRGKPWWAKERIRRGKELLPWPGWKGAPSDLYKGMPER